MANRKKIIFFISLIILLITTFFYKDIYYAFSYVSYVADRMLFTSFNEPTGNCHDVPFSLEEKGMIAECEAVVPRGASYSIDISFMADRKNKQKRNFVRYLVGSNILVSDGRVLKQVNPPKISIVVAENNGQVLLEKKIDAFLIDSEGEGKFVSHLAILNLNSGRYKIRIENMNSIPAYGDVSSIVDFNLYSAQRGK
jgi:hypothetical protein